MDALAFVLTVLCSALLGAASLYIFILLNGQPAAAPFRAARNPLDVLLRQPPPGNNLLIINDPAAAHLPARPPGGPPDELPVIHDPAAAHLRARPPGGAPDHPAVIPDPAAAHPNRAQPPGGAPDHLVPHAPAVALLPVPHAPVAALLPVLHAPVAAPLPELHAPVAAPLPAPLAEAPPAHQPAQAPQPAAPQHPGAPRTPQSAGAGVEGASRFSPADMREATAASILALNATAATTIDARPPLMRHTQALAHLTDDRIRQQGLNEILKAMTVTASHLADRAGLRNLYDLLNGAQGAQIRDMPLSVIITNDVLANAARAHGWQETSADGAEVTRTLALDLNISILDFHDELKHIIRPQPFTYVSAIKAAANAYRSAPTAPEHARHLGTIAHTIRTAISYHNKIELSRSRLAKHVMDAIGPGHIEAAVSYELEKHELLQPTERHHAHLTTLVRILHSLITKASAIALRDASLEEGARAFRATLPKGGPAIAAAADAEAADAAVVAGAEARRDSRQANNPDVDCQYKELCHNRYVDQGEGKPACVRAGHGPMTPAGAKAAERHEQGRAVTRKGSARKLLLTALALLSTAPVNSAPIAYNNPNNLWASVIAAADARAAASSRGRLCKVPIYFGDGSICLTALLDGGATDPAMTSGAYDLLHSAGLATPTGLYRELRGVTSTATVPTANLSYYGDVKGVIYRASAVALVVPSMLHGSGIDVILPADDDPVDVEARYWAAIAARGDSTIAALSGPQHFFQTPLAPQEPAADHHQSSPDKGAASDTQPGERLATLDDLAAIAPDQSAWRPDTAQRLLDILNRHITVFGPPNLHTRPLAFPPQRIETTSDRAFDASYARVWDRFTPSQYKSFMGATHKALHTGHFSHVDRLGYELHVLPDGRPGARVARPDGAPPPHAPCIHSPVLVPKGIDGARPAIDMRPTNLITVPMAMDAMPSCDEVLARLAGGLVYSIFDAASFHYQIHTHPDDRHKCCFHTPEGIVRLNVIPQGWVNSSVIAQQVMDHVVGPLNQPLASHTNHVPDVLTEGRPSLATSFKAYQDDNAGSTGNPVHYPDYPIPDLPAWGSPPTAFRPAGTAPMLPEPVVDAHLHDAELFLHFCVVHNLQLSWDKQRWCQPFLDLVGERASAHGRSISPERLDGIATLILPSTFVEAAAGLGIMGFLRKFVTNFSDLADIFKGPPDFRAAISLPKPADADRRPGRFKLTDLQRWAWEELKTALLRGIVLSPMDHRYTVVILADCSARGMGSVILVGHNLDLFSCMSLALDDAQRNYSVPDREGLAGFTTITRNANALRGAKQVLWVSDHANLQRLADIHRKGLVDIASQRLRRWFDTLFQELNINLTIVTVPGKHMVAADALSRLQPSGPSDHDPSEPLPLPGWLEGALSPDPELVDLASRVQHLRPPTTAELLHQAGMPPSSDHPLPPATLAALIGDDTPISATSCAWVHDAMAGADPAVLAVLEGRPSRDRRPPPDTLRKAVTEGAKPRAPSAPAAPTPKPSTRPPPRRLHPASRVLPPLPASAPLEPSLAPLTEEPAAEALPADEPSTSTPPPALAAPVAPPSSIVPGHVLYPAMVGRISEAQQRAPPKEAALWRFPPFQTSTFHGIPILLHHGSIWVPDDAKDIQDELSEAAHAACGWATAIAAIAALVAAHVNWRRRRAHVTHWVASSPRRQTTRHPRPNAFSGRAPAARGDYLQSLVPAIDFTVYLDFLGPLASARHPDMPDGPEHSYILVLIDPFSRLVDLLSCAAADAAHAIAGLQAWAVDHGFPFVIRSDGARHFDNHAVGEWAAQHGALYVPGVPLHAAGQGIVERTMGPIVRALKALMADGQDWTHFVASSLGRSRHALRSILNDARSRTTGRSPFNIVHGHPRRGALAASVAAPPSDNLADTPDDHLATMAAAHGLALLGSSVAQAASNARHQAEGPHAAFVVGDFVQLLADTEHKLQPVGKGVYIVRDRLSPSLYAVSTFHAPDDIHYVATERLAPYDASRTDHTAGALAPFDGYHIITAILNHQGSAEAPPITFTVMRTASDRQPPTASSGYAAHDLHGHVLWRAYCDTHNLPYGPRAACYLAPPPTTDNPLCFMIKRTAGPSPRAADPDIFPVFVRGRILMAIVDIRSDVNLISPDAIAALHPTDEATFGPTPIPFDIMGLGGHPMSINRCGLLALESFFSTPRDRTIKTIRLARSSFSVAPHLYPGVDLIIGRVLARTVAQDDSGRLLDILRNGPLDRLPLSIITELHHGGHVIFSHVYHEPQPPPRERDDAPPPRLSPPSWGAPAPAPGWAAQAPQHPRRSREADDHDHRAKRAAPAPAPPARPVTRHSIMTPNDPASVCSYGAGCHSRYYLNKDQTTSLCVRRHLDADNRLIPEGPFHAYTAFAMGRRSHLTQSACELAIQHARTLGTHSDAIIADIQRGPAPQAPVGVIGQHLRGITYAYDAEPIANDRTSLDAFDRARGQALARTMLGGAPAPGVIWAGVPAALAHRAAPGAEGSDDSSPPIQPLELVTLGGANDVPYYHRHSHEIGGSHAGDSPHDPNQCGSDGEPLLDYAEDEANPP